MEVETHPQPRSEEERAEILADPGFGIHFTDHMVTIDYDPPSGWHRARVRPYGPLHIMPGASALHYAQQVFEGLKAYRHADGSVWAFRPEMNASRLRRSAERFYLPAPDDTCFLGSLTSLLAVDHEWVPDPDGEKSLYLRPFVIGTEQYLGVRPSPQATYGLIASPSGAYVGSGLTPIDVWLTREHTRASRGGTGEAKYGGNYAAGLGPYREAAAHGCSQTVFLDAETRSLVEELGGMNIMFVTRDSQLVTPKLSGTILRGITRASILELAAEELGLIVEERSVSLAEWKGRVSDGSITEVFACGTAAVITPIGSLKARDFELEPARNTAGHVTRSLRTLLTDLQYGRSEDTRGWMTKLYG